MSKTTSFENLCRRGKKTIFQVKSFKHFCNSTLKGKQNRLLVYTLQHKEASRMLLAKPSKIEPSSCRKFDSVSKNKSFSFKILKIRLKLQLTCIHVSIFLKIQCIWHISLWQLGVTQFHSHCSLQLIQGLQNSLTAVQSSCRTYYSHISNEI